MTVQGAIAGREPAACGRRRCGAGAQPCSCTPSPRRPALAAVGGGGSEALWPRPQWWRPWPWGSWPSVGTLRAAQWPPPAPSGRCRLYPAADASPQEAVGRWGIGRLGVWRWWAVAALGSLLQSSMRSWRAWAPSATLPGCCRLHRAADAPSSGAVGRVGIGQFGVLTPRVVLCAPAAVAWRAAWLRPGDRVPCHSVCRLAVAGAA
jgi:hypothetical protein